MPMAPQQPSPARPALPAQPPGCLPGPGWPGQEDEEPGCGCPTDPHRPLPDLAAVRLLRVPDSAPPYDAPALSCCGAAGPHVPGATGFAVPAAQEGRAGGAGGTGETAHHSAGGGPGEAGTGGQDGDGDAGTGTGHAGRGSGDGGSGDGDGDGRPPAGWPSQFAQVLAETLAGHRPARQIRPWTTERARTHIQRLGAQLSAGQRPRIRRVIATRPALDVVEMTVIVGFGPRVRALAVRLERADPAVPAGLPPRSARWLCTAVEAA